MFVFIEMGGSSFVTEGNRDDFGLECTGGQGFTVSLLCLECVGYNCISMRDEGRDSPSQSSLLIPYFLAKFSAVTTDELGCEAHSMYLLTSHSRFLPSGILVHQARRKRILQLQIYSIASTKSDCISYAAHH